MIARAGTARAGNVAAEVIRTRRGMRPKFTRDRGAGSARAFPGGSHGAKRRRTGWMRAVPGRAQSPTLRWGGPTARGTVMLSTIGPRIGPRSGSGLARAHADRPRDADENAGARSPRPPARQTSTVADRITTGIEASDSSVTQIIWSGRSGSNRRHSAWEADVLPLNYARAARRRCDAARRGEDHIRDGCVVHGLDSRPSSTVSTVSGPRSHRGRIPIGRGLADDPGRAPRPGAPVRTLRTTVRP